MTRALVSVLLLAGVATQGFQAAPGPPAERTTGHAPLRVLTYNIHHGEGTDGRVDLSRLAGVMSRVHPDLVALAR